MNKGSSTGGKNDLSFALFECAPGMRLIFLPDAPKFTIVAISEDLSRAFGFSKDHAIGNSVFDVFPNNAEDPLDTGDVALRESLEYVIRTGSSHQLPLQRYDVKQQDGSFRESYWKVMNTPFKDESGEVQYIIHSTEDITELIKADVYRHKMKGVEQAHRDFMQAPVLVMILRGPGHIIELANKAALSVWLKTDEIIGQSLSDALPDFIEQPAGKKIDEVFHSGKMYREDEVELMTGSRADRKLRWFDIYYKPFYEDGSTKTNGVFAMFNEVSERVKAAKINEENEAKYHSLFQSLDQGFCVIEMIYDAENNPVDYRFLETNPVFDMQTGLKDAVGKTAREAIPGLESHWVEIYGKIAETGIAQQFSEGSVAMGRWFDVYAYKSGGAESKKVALLFKDITEQKKKDDIIRESEQRFRALADESPMFVFIIDANPLAPVSYWNKTWLDYTGQTAEEAFGTAWNGILHEEDLAVVMQHYVPAFEKHDAYYIPAVRVKKKDGTYRWHAFKGNPRYLVTGEFNGYVGVGFDIHDQKIAEEALKQSEARTRLAVETAQLGTFEIDVNAQKMIYSDRAAEIFGLDENIEWPYTAFSDRIFHEDIPIRTAAHHSAKETGDLFYEARIVLPDDRLRWIRINGRHDTDPIRSTMIGTIMDITEEKRAAEILEQKIELRTRELKLVNDQLKQFAYSASHDLQEPLRKISYFLDRLLMNIGPSLSEENKKITDRIQLTAGRMRNLIDDLLSYSNTTLGITKEEDISLNEIVQEVMNDMEASLIEQDAEIHYEDLPLVKGDHRQLRQLMQNLLSNAVKYRNKNVAPKVEITARSINGMDIITEIPAELRQLKLYHLMVKDNGIGFEKENAARIFTLFQRLHGKLEYEGTGVGLAIVQKVIENHGGYIWAESELGEGATFNILLPAE